MNWRFLTAIAVVIAAVGFLMVTAVNSSAKAVVTVAELLNSGERRENIRLGARVTADPIVSSGGSENPEVKFRVKDIVKADATPSSLTIAVTYRGLQPDTLKAERDVILEGHFDGQGFQAKNLMTQCPSKYKPPTPGEAGAGVPDNTSSQEAKH